jgi:hypothetical protein
VLTRACDIKNADS